MMPAPQAPNKKAEYAAPAYKVTVGGKDISAKIRPRLISLDIIDNRGFETDTVSLVLDDTDGKLSLPKKGETMQVWIGWKNQPLVDKGTYTIDELEHSGAPDQLSIRGKAADLRGSLNQTREQSYHGQTLADILAAIAGRNQLDLSVLQEWGQELVEHLDQQNESDVALITRLAKLYDAIATIKQGKLLFIKAGQSQSASGSALPSVTITRQSGDGHRFSIADRDTYHAVVAHWQNNKGGKKEQVKVSGSAEDQAEQEGQADQEGQEAEILSGDQQNIKTLRHVYSSKRNAQRAARAEWDKLQRGVAKFSINLATGRPELFPELPVTVRGFKSQIDQSPWLLTRVTHNLNDSGYTNALELEVKTDAVPE